MRGIIIKSTLCFCQRKRPWLSCLFCIYFWVNYGSIHCKDFFPGGYPGWLWLGGDGLAVVCIKLILNLALSGVLVEMVFIVDLCTFVGRLKF